MLKLRTPKPGRSNHIKHTNKLWFSVPHSTRFECNFLCQSDFFSPDNQLKPKSTPLLSEILIRSKQLYYFDHAMTFVVVANTRHQIKINFPFETGQKRRVRAAADEKQGENYWLRLAFRKTYKQIKSSSHLNLFYMFSTITITSTKQYTQ